MRQITCCNWLVLDAISLPPTCLQTAKSSDNMLCNCQIYVKRHQKNTLYQLNALRAQMRALCTNENNVHSLADATWPTKLSIYLPTRIHKPVSFDSVEQFECAQFLCIYRSHTQSYSEQLSP